MIQTIIGQTIFWNSVGLFFWHFIDKLFKINPVFIQDLFENIIYKNPAIFLGLNVLIHIY